MSDRIYINPLIPLHTDDSSEIKMPGQPFFCDERRAKLLIHNGKAIQTPAIREIISLPLEEIEPREDIEDGDIGNTE